MADDRTAAGDEEPTRVTPVGDGGTLSDAVPDVPPTVTPSGAVVDEPTPGVVPAASAAPVEPAAAAGTGSPNSVPPTPDATAARGGSVPPASGASDVTAAHGIPVVPAVEAATAPPTGSTPPPGAGPASAAGTKADPGAGAKADPGTGDKDSARARGRAAAGRTAEGAKVVGDRVSQAASATAQALRDTDVREIAEHTTNLIENARPFFLAAFAIVFSFLASVENHAAIGVVFAIGAILCVLGAAYAAELTKVIGPRGERGRQSRK